MGLMEEFGVYVSGITDYNLPKKPLDHVVKQSLLYSSYSRSDKWMKI